MYDIMTYVSRAMIIDYFLRNYQRYFRERVNSLNFKLIFLQERVEAKVFLIFDIKFSIPNKPGILNFR